LHLTMPMLRSSHLSMSEVIMSDSTNVSRSNVKFFGKN